jgi:hypothetical protein
MSIITTFTGRQVDLLHLRVEDVDVIDIAHALAHICRWSGHTREFYSVAQHSVLVGHRVYARSGSPALALAGLFHDASEAYLGDMASPLKRTAWAAGYRHLECDVMGAVANRFGLLNEMPRIVREADLELLATEARDLMPVSPVWSDADDMPPALPERLRVWTSELSEQAFLLAWERYAAAVAAGPVL